MNLSETVLEVLKKLDISATFFFRVFSPNYNPSSIACLELYKLLKNQGHEIGLHHDAMVAADILRISPLEAFLMQKSILEISAGVKILGSASHGSRYPRNNQDLFSMLTLPELDLRYQAYDQEPGGLFGESRYVSDSEWTQWKSYSRGKLLTNDLRGPELHATESDLLYVLIHPDTYYERHSFESFIGAS
jgi:peptidoglycan/xylan/chitin deacetylase (PgdA/CDA1 family)